MGGWRGGGWVGGGMGGGRGGSRGFSSLLKQNKKGKNCAVFCFAGIFFLNFLCYEVFAKQKRTKSSAIQ
jgi:hypothetical protein